MPTGRLLTAEQDPNGIIATSTDGGATWSHGPYLPPYRLGSFTALLPGRVGSEGVPLGGRVVGFGLSGLTYSDDEGATWTGTDVVCDFCMRVENVVVLDGGPEDGRAVASLDDQRPGGVSGGVWHSADGATWTRVGRSFTDTDVVHLLAVPGGGLLAFSGGRDLVLASDDGGRSWQSVGEVDAGGSYFIEELAVGPDGRIYAAMEHYLTSPPVYGGVWRTEVVFDVAEERAPSGVGRLEVFPNPAGDTVTVRLGDMSGEAGRMEVTDVRGRVVQTVAVGAGTQTVTVDVSGLAAGVYVVQTETGASARFTVGR